MADLIETAPDAIASYPFDDLEEGFGLVTYYLSNYVDASGTSYLMQKQLLFSADSAINYTGAATNTQSFYSGGFSRPRTIKGTIIANFCCEGKQGSSGQNYTFSIKVYHYDGSTSTQIGSTWTGETVSLTNDPSVRNITAVIPVTSAVKFRAGDQIRFDVILTRVNTGNAGGEVVYGIDPQNRDWSLGSHVALLPSSVAREFTQFVVRVPFNLVN